MDAWSLAWIVGFLFCGGLLAYTYAGYPVLLWLAARCFGRDTSPPADDTEEACARLSLLIAAHNEEAVIDQRIRNALEMAYPLGKLEIAVVTDGCTDGTAEHVRRYASEGVRLIELPERGGKASALNAAVPRLHGEIVMFSDANTFTDVHAARCLARWFAEPHVGVVCGRLVLTDPSTGRNADSLYWKYETALKRCEGRLGAVLGANGAIYAMRRDLFAAIPADTLIDDFIIPLDARLRSGCAIVYDPDALAFEETSPTLGCEFQRRARIGAGGFQSIYRLRRLLPPGNGWIALSFLSHKVLRWLGPFLLFGALVCNLGVLGHGWGRWLLAAQGIFYLFSVLLMRMNIRSRLLKPLLLPAMFTSMNAALLVGCWRWLLGAQGGVWRRTTRGVEISASARRIEPQGELMLVEPEPVGR